MSKTILVMFTLVLSAVTLSCTFLKGGSSNSLYGVGDISKTPPPSVDPDEPFPAISSDMIDAFIKEIPELGKHREKVLTAEREAINGLLVELRAKSQAGTARPITLSPQTDVMSKRADVDHTLADILEGRYHLIPAAYAAGEPSLEGLGGFQQFLIGHQIGYFTVEAGAVDKADRGKSKTVEMKDENTGTVQATMELSVNKDGSVSTELTTKVSMPLFGLDANSKVKVTGDICPDADGKVNLTIESSSNGRAGSSGSVIYDKNLTGKIRASVNDDAELAGIDIDLKQATRSTAGGRQVYVETSQSGQGKTGNFSDIQFGDARLDRVSSQANPSDAALSQNGLTGASRLAQGVLQSAEHRWQGGGCVKIDAVSPGSVQVNSTTQIPVKVTHKFGGGEVPSKLKAELSGGASIDPTLIPRTAGTLSYVAPAEAGKTATIKLTANSLRGRATLDLTASTGGNSYQVVGGAGDWQTNSKVCDIMKPFALTGLVTMNFSGGMSGTYEYSGGPFEMKGGGTYSISLPDGPGKPGSMTGGTTGTITGGGKVYKGKGNEHYTLTPIEPCQ